MVAAEIVLVPEIMQVGRLGFVRWDPLRDYTSGAVAPKIKTTMINGSVFQITSEATRPLHTTIANGTVVQN